MHATLGENFISWISWISFDLGNTPGMTGQSDVLGTPSCSPSPASHHTALECVAHDWLTLDVSLLPNVRIFWFWVCRKWWPHGKYKNYGLHHLHLTQLFLFKTPAFLHIYTSSLAAPMNKVHCYPIWVFESWILEGKQCPPAELRKTYLNVFLPNIRAEQSLCLPVKPSTWGRNSWKWQFLLCRTQWSHLGKYRCRCWNDWMGC